MQKSAIALALTVIVSAIGRPQAPALTQISDSVICRTTGAPFSGNLIISQHRPEASPSSFQQLQSVAISNGYMSVRLVPNANWRSIELYRAFFDDGGPCQFVQIWSVPATDRILLVQNVELDHASGVYSADAATPAEYSARTLQREPVNVKQRDSSTPAAGSVNAQSDVEEPRHDFVSQEQIEEKLERTYGLRGLPSQFAARPVMGPGFGTSAAAVINQFGQIETATGNPSDCVFVDGTSGPCVSSGSPASMFVDAEVPMGSINGTNKNFTLAGIPIGLSLKIYRNGLFMTAGIDYVLNGSTVIFVDGATPQVGDGLIAFYRTVQAAAQ